jgi:hypothetical protein
MLSVVIAAQDNGRRLVATLAALVPGAIAGVVREVVVADSGSSDIAEIADIAGCRVLTSDGPLGDRLKAASAVARSSWLLFLKPGWIPDPSWIGETRSFIETNELAGRADRIAAVFRRAPTPGTPRAALAEALALLTASFGTRPRPEQGLLITKRLYERLDGHRGNYDDPEIALLRRLGRRRIVTLRSAAATSNGTLSAH